MQNLEIIAETETLLWAREKDQIRALGLVLMLSSVTEQMAGEPLMQVLERHQACIARGQYFILYERKNQDSPLPVPVAFMTWGLLSRPAGVVFEQGLRPLNFTEMKSGRHLWVMDCVAQFGHVKQCLEQFSALFKLDHGEFYTARLRDGRWRKETHTLRKE